MEATMDEDNEKEVSGLFTDDWRTEQWAKYGTA